MCHPNRLDAESLDASIGRRDLGSAVKIEPWWNYKHHRVESQSRGSHLQNSCHLAPPISRTRSQAVVTLFRNTIAASAIVKLVLAAEAILIIRRTLGAQS